MDPGLVGEDRKLGGRERRGLDLPVVVALQAQLVEHSASARTGSRWTNTGNGSSAGSAG